MISIKRTNIRLKADPKKVVPRFLRYGDVTRLEAIVPYMLRLEPEEAASQLKEILSEFQSRHFDLKSVFLENYGKLATHIPGNLSLAKKLLVGAYFTHEYSIEAAALFNPSIVPHPDQSGLAEGALKFVLSLRACGEGHISSLAFLTGRIDANGEIKLEPSTPKLTCGEIKTDQLLNRSFALGQMNSERKIIELFQEYLPEQFSRHQAIEMIAYLEKRHRRELASEREKINRIFNENYDLEFKDAVPISSRVVFPQSLSESNGIEDVRFVAFKEGAETRYLGTYTAYDGKIIHPKLIETKDFRYFQIRSFYGPAISNKGLAFFPEKVNGKFAMIGRQGGRSLSIMYSNDLYFWETYQLLQQPERSWEMLQMGNCGSPVKTAQGWLLLTHAVGPMRKYVLSLSLLDLEHPEIVKASLDYPLLSPNEEEREGYVPNVLYTCGMLRHQDKLIIPYAMSDSAVSFAVVEIKEIIKALLK